MPTFARAPPHAARRARPRGQESRRKRPRRRASRAEAIARQEHDADRADGRERAERTDERARARARAEQPREQYEEDAEADGEDNHRNASQRAGGAVGAAVERDVARDVAQRVAPGIVADRGMVEVRATGIRAGRGVEDADEGEDGDGERQRRPGSVRVARRGERECVLRFMVVRAEPATDRRPAAREGSPGM